MSDQVGNHGTDHGTAHGTDHVPVHVHGTMDIRAQEKVFATFLRFVSWGIGISFLILIIMALADS